MRVLVGADVPLPELYAAPDRPWLRVNMVSTVDGAATGPSGTSRSINNSVDKTVFDLLRSLCDAIVVGAGTLRVEGYAPNPKPVVIVSRSGSVPETLLGPGRGPVLLATCAQSPGLAAARELLGPDDVMVLGSDSVDLPRLRAELHDRGFRHLLSEGGPRLLRDLLETGCVDELDATVVPRAVAGPFPRIVEGHPIDVPLRLHTLVEEGGTLMARWLVH